MRKWHDITEAGDPKDLPTKENAYYVTRENHALTHIVWWTVLRKWRYSGRLLTDVIAWREMPRAFVPGKRKTKRKRFTHEVEVSDGIEPQSIAIEDESSVLILAGSEAWRVWADAMWGNGAREYIEQTRVGTPLHVRVTVEMD